jgi:putative tryptophan/tyrosine transport system permease protein
MYYNLYSVLEQIAIFTPLVLGAYCAFSLLKIPYLALESSYVFGAIFGHCMSNVFPTKFVALPFIPLLCSAAGGMIVGLVTYGIRCSTRASFLLASIITTGLFHGIHQLVLQGTHISVPHGARVLAILPAPDSYPQLTTLLLIASLIGTLFFLFGKSAIGISCAIYGDNPHFFSHYAISTHWIECVGATVASILGGVSGFLNASMNGFADISMGFGINLLCITSLILGRTIIKNWYSMTIPLCGIVFYFIVQQMLLHTPIDSQYFTMIQALIIFIILLLAHLFSRKGTYELGL